MKLNVSERLTLVNTLPEKGNFETMKIIESLKDKLYPDEKETKKFEIKTKTNQITWNAEGAKDVEIGLTEGEVKLLTEALEKLDEKSELTFAHYAVFKKFKEKK